MCQSVFEPLFQHSPNDNNFRFPREHGAVTALASPVSRQINAVSKMCRCLVASFKNIWTHFPYWLSASNKKNIFVLFFLYLLAHQRPDFAFFYSPPGFSSLFRLIPPCLRGRLSYRIRWSQNSFPLTSRRFWVMLPPPGRWLIIHFFFFSHLRLFDEGWVFCFFFLTRWSNLCSPSVAKLEDERRSSGRFSVAPPPLPFF